MSVQRLFLTITLLKTFCDKERFMHPLGYKINFEHSFFSALMSLGLLLDGVLYLLPRQDTPCYQYKLIYGLFIVPIITSFFSVLGMAIERFQAFALYRDRRKLTRRFSIAWFMASWTLG